MDRPDVKRLLMTMEAIYPNFHVRDPQNTMDVWSELLKDQDTRLINAALQQFAVTDNSGFAPNVGQLIQAAFDMSQRTMTPSEAWSLVYKAICNSSYNSVEEFNKLPRAIQRAIGSAQQLQAWATDEDFSESVASSNFRRAYIVSCGQERADALLAEAVQEYLSESVPGLEGE